MCVTGSDERACAQSFIRDFGKRASRRPLLSAEADKLVSLYDALRAAPITYTYAEATQTLLSAMLQSPQFLYHWELGPSAPLIEGGSLRLNGYEIASRLAYFLWATMPDDELFAAAESGGLDTADGVASQAQRMLALPQSSYLFTDMVGQWIRLDKLPGLVKDPTVIEIDATLRGAMRSEFEAFVNATLGTRGSYVDLLTSANGFVSAPIAQLYGLSGTFGNQPIATPLPNGRVGLFSQSAFLAIEALPQEGSPVRRGKLVAERLLCRTIPPPPPGLNPEPPAVPDGVQTREAYAAHSEDAACAPCHVSMDPLGFAFEHFDAVGRYRDSEAGRPVDATGTIHGLDGAEVSFNGAGEMMKAIAASDEGQACLVTQLVGYALGRALGEFDMTTMNDGLLGFKSASLDVRKLVPFVASNKSFRYRIPAAGETIQ